MLDAYRRAHQDQHKETAMRAERHNLDLAHPTQRELERWRDRWKTTAKQRDEWAKELEAENRALKEALQAAQAIICGQAEAYSTLEEAYSYATKAYEKMKEVCQLLEQRIREGDQ